MAVYTGIAMERGGPGRCKYAASNLVKIANVRYSPIVLKKPAINIRIWRIVATTIRPTNKSGAKAGESHTSTT
jgi:hypothetical protein